MSFGGLYYPAYTPGFGSKPRFQSTHPFRNLVGAGSNMNNQWSGGSGQSGYGVEPSDYDYHSGPSAHVPSGGSYSYHAATGSGYGPPAAPAVHPPAKPLGGGGGKKGILGGGGGKKGSSAMSALTLLSFLFFINLLQGCIKDHMDAMNPTMMVMTTNVIRNRFNKMGEMNSREQSSNYNSNAANIVMQPADLVAAAAAQSPSKAQYTGSSVSLQTPYSNNPLAHNTPPPQTLPPVVYSPQPQPPAQYMHNTPEPEIPISYAKPQYDPHKPDAYDHVAHLPPPQPQTHFYNNRTLLAQPPQYNVQSQEPHYNYHHTEYNAQPPPQPSIIIPQYANSQKPYYEHQHPVTSSPYTGDVIPQYGAAPNDYNFRQKHEMPLQPQNTQVSAANNNAYPWSSQMLQSSSVVSGPFRRASIVAVSPKTKWVTVPAKITDRTHFDAHADEVEEVLEHHDDRDVFHSRFN